MSKKTDPKAKSAEDRYKDVPESGMEAEELLTTARLRIVMAFPFFGKIAQNMPLVETDHVPTTAVDKSGRLYFNRKWVNHFTMDDAEFEFGHETMHLVQRCFARKPKGSSHMLWNKAADYLCDTQLVDAGMKQSSISLEMVGEKEMALVHKLETIEAVYLHLLKEVEENTDCKACKKQLQKMKGLADEQKGKNKQENAEINKDEGDEGESDSGSPGEGSGEADGDSDDGHGHGSGGSEEHTCGNVRMCCVGSTSDFGDEADPMEVQKWTEVIVGAKIHAEQKGNMPAGLGEAIDKLTESKVNWKDYLKTSATRVFGRARYTYNKRNRRGFAMQIRLPGHEPDGKCAVLAVDTSASMSVEEVQQCITEGAEILRVCGCRKIWLILHDMRVYFSGYVNESDLTKLKMARGGTSHGEVFACLERRHENPEFNVPKDEEVSLAVLFTDLGTDFPTKAPEYEVLWGVPTNGCPGMAATVPFGKKVPVEMKKGKSRRV